jgi:integrase/recombinase XerD
VHPHAFRHTFARELYDEGVGILEIMLALGHSSVKTTQTYLQSIGANEVISVTSARGPW